MTTVSTVAGSEVVYDDGGSSYFPMPLPAIVGSGAIMADADDSTYWDLAMSSRAFGGVMARRVYAQLPAPSTPFTSAGLTLTIRTDQATIPTHFSDPQINVFIASLDGSTSSESNFGNSFHWSPDSIHITTDSGFTNYTLDLSTGAGGFFSLDDLVTFLNSGDAWIGLNTFGVSEISNTSGFLESRVSELSISDFSLPCQTPVALDLSTAVFLDNSGTLSGQYVDGVICTTTDGLYPDFYFPGLTLEPTKAYRVEVTYDSGSAHNSGSGREVFVAGVHPGSEQSDVDAAFAAGGEYEGVVPVLWDTGFATVGDVQSFVVGPGRGPGPIVGDVGSLPSWDDGTVGVAQGFTAPWFETHPNGAVSGITITKLCVFVAPPLRLTNRNDVFASAQSLTRRSSRQGSNRLTGYL